MKPDNAGGMHLLLGVTGGIASGKTAVSKMLSELGAPIVDFDVIARQVVEPGKPAWKDIVDHFGEDILLENRTLDRKKLSNIVFNDPEQKKKLEYFTHVPIGETFITQVDDITKKNPDAVIQVAVPLLIENNMQHMFDKILVVYVPGKTQIKRLALRDNISEDDATNIVSNQLPIDDKVQYADFLINNEKPLEETRKQVDTLWRSLNEIQKKIRGEKPCD